MVWGSTYIILCVLYKYIIFYASDKTTEEGYDLKKKSFLGTHFIIILKDVYYCVRRRKYPLAVLREQNQIAVIRNSLYCGVIQRALFYIDILYYVGYVFCWWFRLAAVIYTFSLQLLPGSAISQNNRCISCRRVWIWYPRRKKSYPHNNITNNTCNTNVYV